MQAYSSSFPSGHSMISAVVYLTLGVLLVGLVHRRRLKFYFLSIAVTMTPVCPRRYRCTRVWWSGSPVLTRTRAPAS